ncbi:hypothetical protein TNCV_3826281 [Trichonephila clavipes]|nr:hypothetical protein TNCV_3826281 [Trichonephila clavipes]
MSRQPTPKITPQRHPQAPSPPERRMFQSEERLIQVLHTNFTRPQLAKICETPAPLTLGYCNGQCFAERHTLTGQCE